MSCVEIMRCLSQERCRKLPASRCCKSLSSLIRSIYTQYCCSSGTRIPSSQWSSDDDGGNEEFGTKQVGLNEIRSRQMKRLPSSTDSPSPAGAISWSFTPPLDPRSVLGKTSDPRQCVVEEEEEEGKEEAEGGSDCDGDGGGDGESEAFFSAESFFSRSTVASLDTEPPLLRPPVAWEGFRQCEGWPFGLCRRATMVPPQPPLPSTPADSWKWSRCNNRLGSLTGAGSC